MAFKLYGYWRTGFDLINVPDSPELLESSATSSQELFPLDILDVYFNSQIKIKLLDASARLKDLDYLKLYDQTNNLTAYYSVINWFHTSADVVTINVVQDTVLSCGGAKRILGECNINAVRAHIDPSSDTFGAYCEDDEYLAPKEPLQLVHGGTTGSGITTTFSATPADANTPGGGGMSGGALCRPQIGMFFEFQNEFLVDHTDNVIISSVGLAYGNDSTDYMPADLSQGVSYNGSYTVGTGTGTQQCNDRFPVVPAARGLSVYIPNPFFKKSDLTPYTSTPNTFSYPDLEGNYFPSGSVSGNNARTAMQALRALGLETSILYSYRLPTGAGYMTGGSVGNLPRVLYGCSYFAKTNVNGDYACGGVNAYDFDYLGGQRQADSGTVLPDSSTGLFHNMRVLYGKFRSYIIGSPATGNTLEALPEDLCGNNFTISGTNDVGKHSAPYLYCFTDPRPSGRPYYNFVRLGSNKLNANLNLVDGAISGGQWNEVPVVFSGVSGSYLSALGYNISCAYKNFLASPAMSLAGMNAGLDKSYNQAIAYLDNTWASNMGMSAAVGAAGGMGAGFKYGMSTYDAKEDEYGVDYLFGVDHLSDGTGVMMAGGVGLGAGAATGAATSLFNTQKQQMNAAASRMAARSANQQDVGATMSAWAANDMGQMRDLAISGNVSANAFYQRAVAADAEKLQFEVSHSYQVPRVNFLSSDTIRDITKNCLYYARYTPTIKDLNRMDRILDAYGYKINEIVKGVTRRQNFDYIQGSIIAADWRTVAATIGGRKDLMADLQSQLASGMRIWHVNPLGRAINPGGAYT